jgi:hypothetical protein
MRLLVTLEVKSPGEFRPRIVLVEHDNGLVMNEAKLAQLYNKVNNIPTKLYKWTRKYDGIYKSAWLIRDNTVLEATEEMIYEGLELKLTVNEGVKDKHAEPTLWIDSKRQVSSLIVI